MFPADVKSEMENREELEELGRKTRGGGRGRKEQDTASCSDRLGPHRQQARVAARYVHGSQRC